VWERARTPQRAAFCAALAEAHARLGSDLAGAAAALDRAEAAWPGRASTRVARARVLLARGDAGGALASFDAARAIDPRAASDPASLRDLARALARGGRLAEARAAYRALVPQSSLLPRDAQAAALVEAGLVSLAAPAAGGDAVAPEALAFLREARSLPANPLLAESALVLALALDRAGDPAGAATQLADAARMGASAERARELAPGPAEGLALEALALEPTDRAGALAAWERLLGEAPGSPWQATAERRRDALRAAPRPRGRRGRGR
jgi:tetratricopeptide (TPR) repeat protein